MRMCPEGPLLERDRPPRTLTCEPCVLARHNGSTITGTLCNVSEDGFCIECLAALQPGEVVELRVLGITSAGTIRWAKEGRAGGILRR